MGRSDLPLLIGGTRIFKLHNGYVWNVLPERGVYGFESLKGYIDRVMVLKDGKTIALWEFEEGEDSLSYSDLSGNGYMLRARGSLVVESQGKLATIWGRLKTK